MILAFETNLFEDAETLDSYMLDLFRYFIRCQRIIFEHTFYVDGKRCRHWKYYIVPVSNCRRIQELIYLLNIKSRVHAKVKHRLIRKDICSTEIFHLGDATILNDRITQVREIQSFGKGILNLGLLDPPKSFDLTLEFS